jgi:uncharacterized membrane protein HdeD (DUF308 family)
MEVTLSRHWWLLALRGLAGILFGILAIFAPGTSLLALMILFGGFAFAHGMLGLMLAVRMPRGERRSTSFLIEAVAGFAAGLLAMLWPAMTALVLLLVIAAWSVAVGITTIVDAIRLRHQVRGEWLMILSGALSVAFGVLMFAFPGAGALALVWWIGAYAIVTGALILSLAVKLRSRGAGRAVPAGNPPPAPA